VPAAHKTVLMPSANQTPMVATGAPRHGDVDFGGGRAALHDHRRSRRLIMNEHTNDCAGVFLDDEDLCALWGEHRDAHED